MKATDDLDCFKINDSNFKLDSDFFWFPSNYKSNASMDLTIITPLRFDVDVNGNSGNTGKVNNLKSTSFHFDKISESLIIMGKG